MKIQFQPNNFKSFSQGVNYKENKNKVSISSNRESMPYASAPNAFHPGLVSFNGLKPLHEPFSEGATVHDVLTGIYYGIREHLMGLPLAVPEEHLDINESAGRVLSAMTEKFAGNERYEQWAGYLKLLNPSEPMLSLKVLSDFTSGDSKGALPAFNAEAFDRTLTSFFRKPSGDFNFKQQYQNILRMQYSLALKDHGITAKTLPNKMLELSHYKVENKRLEFDPNTIDSSKESWVKDPFRIGFPGVDENELFNMVQKVVGDVDLTNSKLTSTGNLEEVGGNFKTGPELRSSSVKVVKGDLDASNCKIAKLDIGTVDGNVHVSGDVDDLGNLKVGGNLYFTPSSGKRLPSSLPVTGGSMGGVTYLTPAADAIKLLKGNAEVGGEVRIPTNAKYVTEFYAKPETLKETVSLDKSTLPFVKQ